jgi:hypothetical protein
MKLDKAGLFPRAFLTLIALVVFATAFDARAQRVDPVGFFGGMTFRVHANAGATPSIPTMTAGTLIPAGQTPTQASMSTSTPRCGDSTWGSGCGGTGSLGSTFCAPPTTGSPLQTCQPPQELVITGSTYTGSTATIDYTSYANYAYPVGEALLIKNAVQSNWNTPAIHLSSPPTFSGSTVTLNFSAQPSALAVGSNIYVNGITGSDVSNQVRSFGFTGPNPNIPVSPAKAWTVGASPTTTSLTYNMGAGNIPIGKFSVTSYGTHPASANTFITGVAVTGGSGTGMIVNAECQLGIGIQPSQLFIVPGSGTGYVPGDVVSIPNGSFSGTDCNGNSLTLAAPGTPTVNNDSYYGTVISPWTATASSCNNTTHACTVSFTTANACGSGTPSTACVNSGTQIVAGQFDSLIMSWHYGEDVPNSLQNGQVLSCVEAKHVSGVRYVSFSLDGGPFTTITSPMVDPWGPGQSGLSTSNVLAYCARFQASAVSDGLHEVVAIGCPNAGYCTQLNSQLTADATSGSAVLTARGHGLPQDKTLAVRAPSDPAFPNFDWNQSSYEQSYSGMTVTGGSSTGSDSFTVNYTSFAGLPQLAVGSYIVVDGTITADQCSVTGGTATGTTLTLNLSGSAGCSFPTGSSVNIASVALSAGSGTAAYAWNGVLVPVTSGGTCTGSCTTSIQVSSLSTGTWSSGGTVTANWNGPCQVTASTLNTSTLAASATCSAPGTASAASTWSSGGTVGAYGNLMCNPPGGGDWPAPYNSATQITGFYNTTQLQLIPYAIRPVGSGNPSYSCTVTQNQTGCQVTAATPNCGNVATKNETLWLTIFSGGLDEKNTVGWGSAENLRSSLFIYTNADNTIKKQDAYVDSWNTGASTSGCVGSVTTAGTYAAIGGVTPCSNTKSAQYALAASNMGSSQAVSRGAISGFSSCTLFTLSGNTLGAVPFYVGEPVDFVGTDTNSGANFRRLGLYWIVAAASDVLALSATPTGTCIDEPSTNIAQSAAGTALLYNDLGFDSELLECGTSCTSSNPETYLDQTSVTVTTKSFYSKSSYFSILPDAANGVNSSQVSLNEGIGTWFSGYGAFDQGGRMRVGVNSTDKPLSLTAAVPIGPTPANTTPTGGSLSATGATLPGGQTCSAAQCETLTFPAVLDQATRATNGAKFQPPTSTGGPGQGIVVSGTTSSSGSWNCGSSQTSYCNVIDSTPTSVSFVNSSASGSLVYNYTVAITSAGSGGTNGTYTSVALSCLTGGCSGSGGSGALATIVVSSNKVTSATITTYGTNYLNGDILTGSAGADTTFQLTVTTAKIIPVNIVLETAAGTYGGLCASGSTFISTPTTGATWCEGSAWASSSITTAYGTNHTSFPVQLGATSLLYNANCFPLRSGNSGIGQTPPYISSVTAGTGGNNDVIILNSAAAAGGNLGVLAFYANNQCSGSGDGPFVFGNVMMVAQSAATDWWYDKQENSGAGIFNNFLGGSAPSTTGALIITDSIRSTRSEAMDVAAYAWGDFSQYSPNSCIIRSTVTISDSCQSNGGTTIPESLGGTLNAATGGPWLPITGSLDATGAQVQCTDTVVGSSTYGTSINCVNSTSKSLEFATGTLPPTTSNSWGVYVVCNMSIPLTTSSFDMDGGSSLFTSFNNSSGVTATVTFALGQNPITGSCPISAIPGAVLYNGLHIDWQFIQSTNQLSAPASGIGGSARTPWSFFNSWLEDNVSCSPCGTMEGIDFQDGGNFDLSFDHMNGGLSQMPVPTQFTFFSWGVPGEATQITNVLLTNSFMGTSVGSNFNSPITSDVFMLNSTGGLNPSFPATPSLNPWNSGFWEGAGLVMSPGSGGSAAGIPDNYTVWPSSTRSVNGSGAPVAGAPPWSGSLGACPWDCTLTDPGNGSL